jgi:hypothetical protein
VAGTTLNQSSNSGSRAATETVWNSTGSGCSAYDPKPTWQTDPGCANRTVADTAAVADPGTGVWVYYNGGWSIDGGTSISSAVIAGVYGLADGASAASLYADPTALNDVTSGSNGSCGSYLCAAGAGYDGPSGLGSPNGIVAFESTASAAPAPGYSVTASPSTTAVQAGASASYTLTLTAVGGYTSPVFLTAGGLPSGGIASFAPNPVTPTAGGTTSTLSVATSSSTAMGSYPITITAYGANASLTVRRTTVTLTVATVPTFSIAASPPSASVSGAGAASYSVSLTASGGYSSPVTLSASGLPAGASASFAPNPVTPSASGAPSSMKVSTSANTPAGSYTLSISGNDSSGSSRTTTVVLVVKGDYSLAVSPSSLSIRRGQSGAASVAVNTGDGYSSNVTLSVAGLPKHASASFSPNPVAPGSSGQLAISAGAPTSTGSYTLTVSGQGADGTSRSTTMVLSIR